MILKYLADEEDDEEAWNVLIGEGRVNQDRTIKFVFYSGHEIPIETED